MTCRAARLLASGLLLGCLFLLGVAGCTSGATEADGTTSVPKRTVYESSATVDLAIIFPASATDQEINQFIDEHLSTPASGGREGLDHLPGVSDVVGDYFKKAVYVNFETDTSATGRTKIVRHIEAWESVRQIRQNIAPSDL